MRSLNLFAALLIAPAALIQPANATDEAEKSAIKSFIDSQLKAFLADDGALAYSFAAPMIKDIFPDPEAFMSMVKRGYQPVYRPKDYSFLELKETQMGLTQTVQITDSMGELWNAVYRMEKQPDGSWKISGVWLFKLPQIGS